MLPQIVFTGSQTVKALLQSVEGLRQFVKERSQIVFSLPQSVNAGSQIVRALLQSVKSPSFFHILPAFTAIRLLFAVELL